eukprot:46939-Karenia_brevis.AAC.1
MIWFRWSQQSWQRHLGGGHFNGSGPKEQVGALWGSMVSRCALQKTMVPPPQLSDINVLNAPFDRLYLAQLMRWFQATDQKGALSNMCISGSFLVALVLDST